MPVFVSSGEKTVTLPKYPFLLEFDRPGMCFRQGKAADVVEFLGPQLGFAFGCGNGPEAAQADGGTPGTEDMPVVELGKRRSAFCAVASEDRKFHDETPLRPPIVLSSDESNSHIRCQLRVRSLK